MIHSIPREILHLRHQLSHQQIDDFLKERAGLEFPEGKAASMAKLDQFIRISRILSANAISFIVLKGPLLSLRLYGDPTFRTIGDFDFFIDEMEVPKTVAILGENGFLPNDHWPGERKFHSAWRAAQSGLARKSRNQRPG